MLNNPYKYLLLIGISKTFVPKIEKFVVNAQIEKINNKVI